MPPFDHQPACSGFDRRKRIASRPNLEGLEGRSLLAAFTMTGGLAGIGVLNSRIGANYVPFINNDPFGDSQLFVDDSPSPGDYHTVSTGGADDSFGNIRDASESSGTVYIHSYVQADSEQPYLEPPDVMQVEVGTGVDASPGKWIVARIIPTEAERVGDPVRLTLFASASAFGQGDPGVAAHYDVSFDAGKGEQAVIRNDWRGGVGDGVGIKDSKTIVSYGVIGQTVRLRMDVSTVGAATGSAGTESDSLTYAMLDMSLKVLPLPKPPPNPQKDPVEIKINLTTSESDDISVFTRGGSNQPVYADVVNDSDATRTVTLSVPGGKASLDATTLRDIPPHHSRRITVTQMGVSKKVNDVLIVAKVEGAQVGSEDMTNVEVVLPAHIRAANTPGNPGNAFSMPDRIPPRARTSFTVKVTPNLGTSGQVATLKVAGQSAKAGKVSINGGSTLSLTTTRNISLSTPGEIRGIASPNQTSPGSTGRLQLVAQVRGLLALKSSGFSVAALPQNYRTVLDRAIKNGPLSLPANVIGVEVSNMWESDSGDLSDLAGVLRREEILESLESGSLAGMDFVTQTRFQPATRGVSPDMHTINRMIAGPLLISPRYPGMLVLNQAFTFRDPRFGNTVFLSPRSGFKVSFEVFDDQGTLRLTFTKAGARFTIYNDIVQPGTGIVYYTQSVR